MWWSLLLSLLVSLVKWLLEEYAAGRKLSRKDSERLSQALTQMKLALDVSRDRFGVWPEQIIQQPEEKENPSRKK